MTTFGAVPDVDVTRAVRAIGRVLRRHHLDAATRVRVTAPAEAGAATVVQANIRCRNIATRVQVTGPGGFAVTFAAERLDRQLARLATTQSRDWPDPARPPLAEVTEPRPIVRRKQVDLLTGSPAEATAVMDVMDYDAYLFTDAESGTEAVVAWGDPLGVRLFRQDADVRIPPTVNLLPLTADSAPAPILDEERAAHVLCHHGLPFLFFTEQHSGRGRLLYRRYDGDLSIVEPA
ncbi:sigma 54 modulation/S30EA ribosomal C-terminal domain-containing protein [Nocardia colli]|uniref:sigma 54 modulation/S30EA ribosomal C-terminal domain-containing protein n=1 Tax=Nocardia colli TaxID=2545717 RepID=UPI001CC6A913|nr:sigma 54 modulation/S30EA ribosomal C-terminal domain-containing protein [Nocardia colli]